MPEFPHDEKQTELVNMLTEGLVQYEKALKATGLKTKWSNFLTGAGSADCRVQCHAYDPTEIVPVAPHDA